MFIAHDVELGCLVSVDEALGGGSGSYVCPVCGEAVIVKNGSLVIPHFAHKSKTDCDTFTQDMSAWHKWWQNRFPKANQEHVEELQIRVRDYHSAAIRNNFWRSTVDDLISRHQMDEVITIKHRADVRACGYVIEFQNSPISREEFNERNWFYRAIGCKVVWIFNFIDIYKENRMFCYEEISNKYNGGKYKWKHASKTFADFAPQDHKTRKEDDEWVESDILLFFQIAQACDDEKGIGYIEQVVWAPINDYGEVSYHTFHTSYKITTATELCETKRKRHL